MIIVYNPEDGAPINGFISQGIQLDPHFPDRYEFRNKDGVLQKSNGMVQYEDSTAEELLETYQFLVKLSIEDAQKILNRAPDKEFKCEFPGCDFSTTHKVALLGHKKSHPEDPSISGSEIDPSLIPVGGGKKVASRPVANEKISLEEKETQNGLDKDGVEWYGEGARVTTPDFNRVKKAGQGHFVG